MKIEVIDGRVRGTAETPEEIQMLFGYNKRVIITKKGEWKHRTCDVCGKRFKKAGFSLHMARAHNGKNWSSKRKEAVIV